MRWAEAIAVRVKPRDATRLRWERQWEWVPIVGAVPVLPPHVTDPSRWTSLVRGAWRFAEAIHVKESRVEVLSIRRAARSTAWHGTVVLTLCDNLSCALAHEKRRSKDYGLRMTVCVGSAYCIACNITGARGKRTGA